MDNKPPPQELPPGDLSSYSSVPQCDASETPISCDSRGTASHESCMFSQQALDITCITRCDASHTQISCDSPMDTSEPIGENSPSAETDFSQLPESVTGTTAGDPLSDNQPSTPPASQSADDSRAQDLQATEVSESSKDSSSSAFRSPQTASAQDLPHLSEEQPLASMTASMEQLSVTAPAPSPPQISSRVRNSPSLLANAPHGRYPSVPLAISLPLPADRDWFADRLGQFSNYHTDPASSTTKLGKICTLLARPLPP
ncbi:hypothetical protein COOONC_27287 [Cooperia oncophora]